MDLPLLYIYYKWNHTLWSSGVCLLFCIDVSKAHPGCMCQNFIHFYINNILCLSIYQLMDILSYLHIFTIWIILLWSSQKFVFFLFFLGIHLGMGWLLGQMLTLCLTVWGTVQTVPPQLHLPFTCPPAVYEGSVRRFPHILNNICH